MKVYPGPWIMGTVLAVLLGAAALTGYAVIVYYCWPVLLFVLLALATPALRHRPRVLAFISAFVILTTLSTVGALTGHMARILHARRKCKACEPALELLQKHRFKNGQYPLELAKVEGWGLAQAATDLRIAQGEFCKDGVDLDGINSHDALIYLDTNFVSCIVPVTRQLPVSITRFYVYRWTSDEPVWKYDKVVWFLGLTGNK